MLSYSISSGALESPGLLSSYYVISLALHNIFILIITPKSFNSSGGTSSSSSRKYGRAKVSAALQGEVDAYLSSGRLRLAKSVPVAEEMAALHRLRKFLLEFGTVR